MAIKFSPYTRTQVLVDQFLKDTENIYEFVSQRPYAGKPGKLPEGVILTLKIIKDNHDHGVDPATGLQRENNEEENFEAYVCCGQKHLSLMKKDLVKLVNPIQEHCWYINYSPILRFESVEKYKK